MEKKEAKISKELNDVGGWLLFFIITLVIISPLYNLYHLLSVPYVLFQTIEILGLISLFILVGIFLWLKKPYAVKFAKIFLITSLIVNIVTMLLLHDFSNITSMVGYYIIWIAYLYSSKRVKNVYGNLNEPTQGYQIWPIVSVIYAFINPIFAIIFSIVAINNIRKNSKLKALWLSIVALLIAAAILFYTLFLIGVPMGEENECIQQCTGNLEATYYQYNYSNNMCYCLNEEEKIVSQSRITGSFIHINNMITGMPIWKGPIKEIPR